MSDEFNLDREVALERNIDATGKKWVIHKRRSNGLLFVRPDPDRVDAVIPKPISGLWTKIVLLQNALDQYLNATWDKAEAAQKQAERKKQAAKEVEARNKASKKKVSKKVADDAGTAATA